MNFLRFSSSINITLSPLFLERTHPRFSIGAVSSFLSVSGKSCAASLWHHHAYKPTSPLFSLYRFSSSFQEWFSLQFLKANIGMC